MRRCETHRVRQRYTFGELPRPIQGQLATLGPFLFGAVIGFLLGESAAGYWILTGLGLVGGLAGGLEHPTLRGGAIRGAVTGVSFGTGIVLAHAVSGDPPLARVPSPMVLLIVAGAVGGCFLGTLGALVRTRVLEKSDPGLPVDPEGTVSPVMLGGVVEEPPRS
jgi:hypothetical protein